MSDVPGMLFQMLTEQAGKRPQAPAILSPGRPALSYERLAGFVAAQGAALAAAGIGPYGRVAIVLPPGPELAVAFLSICASAVSAPLNPAFRQEEFDFYLKDLRVNALLAGDPSHPAALAARKRSIPVLLATPCADQPAGVYDLEGLANGDRNPSCADGPEDLALLLHTSGTTARPKIVPLTRANLWTSARNIARSLELSPQDRCLNIMPLFHIHGLAAALLASLQAGGSVVCPPGFQSPLFFDWAATFSPTWYTAVPTMHQAILARAEQHPLAARRARFRFIRSCSAPLAPQVAARLEQVFDAPVIEAYGMTEAAHQISSNPLPPGIRKHGAVGLPTGMQAGIMNESGRLLGPGEEGEIVIRGPSVTTGYLDNPQANQRVFTNGWFRTGDAGVMDEDGYLRITGRLKEIINRGGEKIAPREVDEALMTHPSVAQALAFAIPDSRLGEDIGAAVVLRPGGAASARELREFVAGKLADFKIPSRIVFVDEIPKGPTGKPQRIGLAERLGVAVQEANAPKSARYEPPATAAERLLAEIWSEVLRLDRVGAEDEFLRLGGDSILAAQIAARIRDRLRVDLRLSTLLEADTVRRQAAVVEEALLAGLSAEPSPPPDED